ncbi:hypothetical protein F8388_026165 [Cannabis sativa]|uniref:Uncharacterized protein n=1 Tax=Cannabis sativa TaxID=3483 RepID=A0A7J6FRH7_CANSA|nr:hypothetical protein F8388_026165 [Cannabis sativa]
MSRTMIKLILNFITNNLCLCSEITVKATEDASKEFTTKEDVAIVLISQYVPNVHLQHTHPSHTGDPIEGSNIRPCSQFSSFLSQVPLFC